MEVTFLEWMLTTDQPFPLPPRIRGLFGACVVSTFLTEVHFLEDDLDHRSLFSFAFHFQGIVFGTTMWDLPDGGHFPGTSTLPPIALSLPHAKDCL